MIRALAIYFGWMIFSMLCALPLSPATMLAAKSAPPWLVAIVGAFAAGLTAAFDHTLVSGADRLRQSDGKFGRFFAKMSEKSRAAPKITSSSYARYIKWIYMRVERLAKVAPFVTTAAFAGFPLPFWIVRLIMPLAGYPRWRYVGAVMLGRFGRIFVLAAFGTLVVIPNEILFGLIAFGVLVAIVTAAVQHFKKPAAPPTSPP
jgi:hypothetical protein